MYCLLFGVGCAVFWLGLGACWWDDAFVVLGVVETLVLQLAVNVIAVGSWFRLEAWLMYAVLRW